MLMSMTGFSRQMIDADWGQLTWEVRSVNHRYCEISLRLPEPFRQFEQAFRGVIAQFLSRGKIDATLKYQAGEALPFDYRLNQGLLGQLSQLTETLTQSFPNTSTNAFDVLNWQGVLQVEERGMDVVHAAAKDLLAQCIEGLLETRAQEGQGLLQFFRERIALLREQIAIVQETMPQVLTQADQRIRDRFAELQIDFDQQRFEQEMVWLAQKVDIAEEIKRLLLHLSAFEKNLTVEGAVGRRLDFIMQELNREANTLASKSIDATVTHAAVEMKVLIEQMREQVQNIE